MRQLATTEMQQVSGGDFWTNDGCYISVPSTGIPTEYYKIIDAGVAMIFNGASDCEIDNYFSTHYVPDWCFEQYLNNFDNVEIFCF